MRFQRILSIVLVLLMLTSVTIPAASAGEVAPVAFAIPATAELLVDGAFVTIVSSAFLCISNNLGKTWDETEKGWNKLQKDTGDALTKLLHSGKMINADSPRGEAILTFDYYTAAGAGDKKPDNLYHKAKKEKGKHGKVKISPERISEDEAVKELREGRDIFAPNNEFAAKLTNRVNKENHKALKLKGKPHEVKDEEIELHGKEWEWDKGYYKHYHPEYQSTRPHCWMWRK